MMNISFSGFILLVVLVVLPFIIAYFSGIEKFVKPLKSVAFHTISLALFALIVHYVVPAHNIFINIALVFLVALLAGYGTLLRTQVPKSSYAVPLLASVFITIVLLVLISCFVFGGFSLLFNGSWVFALLSVVCASVFIVMPKGMKTFHNGLANDAQLYHFLIANGATHRQAVNYLTKRSVEKAWLYALKHTSIVLVAVCPWVFAAQLLVGIDAMTAVFFQLFLTALAIVAPLSALFSTLFFARKYALDAYNQLK